MATETVSKPDVIWLKWEDKLDLLGSRDAIHFSAVKHKCEARGDDKQRVNDLLKDYEADLNRSEPGYRWTIEPDGGRPILKHIIRGDRIK